MDSGDLDELDRQLMHALQVDGRASFASIATVLDVSETTVARRYRRLRSAGIVRVVGAVDPFVVGQVSWIIRLQVVPGAASDIAAALARRHDTSWVSILSGGTEIACGSQPESPSERDAFLLDKLPRTRQVVSVSAGCLLHRFTGGPSGWRGLNALTPRQAAALTPQPTAPPTEFTTLDEADRVLVAALTRDGRTSSEELASLCGFSPATARRRISQLRQTGAIYFDVDIAAQQLGYHAEAWLWMSVEPAQLMHVGRTLAQHPEVALAASTTGPTNLIAAITCRHVYDLHHYTTQRIGPLPGVHRLETAPIIRTIKRVGAITSWSGFARKSLQTGSAGS